MSTEYIVENGIEYRVETNIFGTKGWYLDDKLHRVNGPAVIKPDGTKMWCQYGEYHREDGPALEHASGYKAWYLDGIRVYHII